MLSLRWYQLKAKEKLFAYFEKQPGNPLIVLPTGTGKALVIADICRDVCEMDRGARIIAATHSAELVAQNYAEFMGYYENADAGIYSAGLNRKQSGRKVTFGGIQSLYRAAYEFQHIDILIVDEAHTIPHGEEGMWHSFIADLRIMNPYLKVVGLTATPYRMKSGMLHKGEGALFDMIVFEYNVGVAVRDGYLCEITNKSDETGEEITLETHLDASKVKTANGDYIEKTLEEAFDIDEITQAAVNEIIKHGKNRGSWLVFCSGVKHAENIMKAIRAHGITCESVHNKTKKADRRRILAEFKSGKVQCVTNKNVLTTGFNHPGCDMLAILRPTKSPGLWVQILGRGMRIANGKENCLVLDFTDNTSSFGPIDKISVDTKQKEGDGQAPIKTCPECFSTCFAGCKCCPECGYEFPPNELAMSKKASKDALLSSQIEIATATISSVYYTRHTKPGSPDSLRVDYVCGFSTYSEWVCLSHTNSARERACNWWRERSSLADKTPPRNVDEGYDRTGELRLPKILKYKKAGKYTEIVGVEY